MIVNSILTLYSNPILSLTTDEKLPIKAANSLPEFFQEEFPTFQKFIETYYKYQTTSRDGYTKIESIRDIDEIGAKYLDEFYKTFAINMPVFPYMGMADFIRNAKKFYVSRGSEDSFRFLFRIMFGEEIEFKYPQENILRASQGKWSQKVSVYVNILTGSVNGTLVGQKLLIKAFDGSTTALTVKGVTQIQGSIWEIEVEKFTAQTVVAGSKVYALLDPITLAYSIEGTITTTLNGFTVTAPGEDFRLGKVYEYTTLNGIVSFRITALDANRGIKRIEFLSFPNELTTSQTIVISNSSSVDDPLSLDDLVLSLDDFILTLGAPPSASDAVILLTPGTVNRYSGFYESTSGFLSNNNKLQDNYFYQIFSYVIKSKVSRELYEDLVTRILHPAGLIMFSEYEKSVTHNLTVGTESTYEQGLDILDIVNVYDMFQRVYEAERAFTDNISITDVTVLNFNKVLEDTVTITETGLIQYWEAGTYTDPGYWTDELYTMNSYATRTI